MRLITNNDPNILHPEKVLILLRHGVDIPVLSTDLNQPLTEETKPDIEELALNIIAFSNIVNTKKVRLLHSNRVRVIETASIILQHLSLNNIRVSMVETIGLREIYQGTFSIAGHVQGKEYTPLVEAWKVWQQKLQECHLLYRFGDPICGSDGICQYPQLSGYFETFGENQREFSLRLYTALNEVFENDENCLQIITAHQASCSRIQRILDAASKIRSEKNFKPGEFVKFLEKQGARITIEPASGIVVNKPHKDLMISILRKEITYLQTLG